MEHEIAALYRSVRTRLTEITEVWGDRAYVDLAPSRSTLPYAVYAVTELRRIERATRSVMALTLRVTCAADSLSSLIECLGRINDLLDDADYDTPKALDSGYDWVILTMTRGGMIQRAVLVDGVAEYEAVIAYRAVVEPR